MASPASAAPQVLWRIGRSFGYAFEGMVILLRTQPNFAVHVLLACAALALAALLRLPAAEWALLVVTIALVLVTESFNTALEALCDRVSPEYNPLVKRAKDVGAAAVLLAAGAAVLVGIALFGPRLANLAGLR